MKKILALGLVLTAGTALTSGLVAGGNVDVKKKAPAMEKWVWSHSDAVVSMDGQVNEAFTWRDNGSKSEGELADSENDPTQLNVRASARYDVWTFGGHVGVGYLARSGMDHDIRDGGSSGVDVRHADFSVAHDDFGTVFLGKGDMADEGIMEADNSGTTAAGFGPSVAYLGGGVSMNRMISSSTIYVKDVWKDHDGVRTTRVGYVSPTWNGFSLAASHGDHDRSAVAVKYGAEIEGFQVDAGVAGSQRGSFNNDQKEDMADLQANIANAHEVEGSTHDLDQTASKAHWRQASGSFSVLHKDTGLSLGAAGAMRDLRAGVHKDAKRKDMTQWFVKAGWQGDMFDAGKTALAINYGRADNVLANKDKTTTYGAALVQAVEKAGTELYLTGQVFDYKHNTETNPKKVFVGAVGARIKF